MSLRSFIWIRITFLLLFSVSVSVFFVFFWSPLEQLRSVLSQFSAVFASVNDKVSNQQFKSWKKQLETHMKRSIYQWELVNSHYEYNWTHSIYPIRVTRLLRNSQRCPSTAPHSSLLQPLLLISKLCFWYPDMLWSGLGESVVEQHLNDRTELWRAAMFYPVKTWKYKYNYIWYHLLSCWKSWGKPKPLRGKRNLSIESFQQSCFIASLLQTKQSISPHFNQLS